MTNIKLTVDIGKGNKLELSKFIAGYAGANEYSEEVQEEIQNMADQMIAAFKAIYPEDK